MTHLVFEAPSPLVLFLIIALAVFGLLPSKNLRFTIVIDPVIRLLAAWLIATRGFTVRTMAAFAIANAAIELFYRIFARGGVYDPVTQSLLEAVGSLPHADVTATNRMLFPGSAPHSSASPGCGRGSSPARGDGPTGSPEPKINPADRPAIPSESKINLTEQYIVLSEPKNNLTEHYIILSDRILFLAEASAAPSETKNDPAERFLAPQERPNDPSERKFVPSE